MMRTCITSLLTRVSLMKNLCFNQCTLSNGNCQRLFYSEFYIKKVSDGKIVGVLEERKKERKPVNMSVSDTESKRKKRKKRRK